MIVLLLLILLSLSFLTYQSPIEIVLKKGFPLSNVYLNTNIVRFESYLKSTNTNSKIVVDLISTLHIADYDYYKSIKNQLDQYDIVLYELITDNNNIIIDNKNTFKKRLNADIVLLKANELANQLGLRTQMDLNPIDNDNWYIADLDSNTVRLLEDNRKDIITQQYVDSQIGGRGSNTQFMKSFFLSDTNFITILRLFSWLLPCPELFFILLDWSRTSPRPGGIPDVLVPIANNIITGNIKEAKKLSFAKQIVSGLSDRYYYHHYCYYHHYYYNYYYFIVVHLVVRLNLMLE